jgi:transmembrane sensor
MPSQQRLEYLFQKYLDKSYSEADKAELFSYLAKAEHDAALGTLIDKSWERASGAGRMDEGKADLIFKNIVSAGRAAKPPVRRISFLRYAAAAVILVMFGTAGYFLLFNHRPRQAGTATTAPVHDVAAPPLTKATLTLADGQQVSLEGTGRGVVAKQGGVSIVQLDNGQLSYSGTGQEALYNTLTNPKGSRVVSVVLPDGTKVWLNAESSLRYPTAFTSATRRVEINGEGYFEVSHDAQKPFVVAREDVEVQVLGTHFNVNAFGDEPSIAVTLLEGKVKISRGDRSETLLPGEQASVVSATKEIRVKKNVDVDHVVAWKNGLFDFADDPLSVVMRQLSRWYDADVRFEGGLPEGHYTGAIRRQARLSEVLRMLELAGGVQFEIKGKEIVVQNKK